MFIALEAHDNAGHKQKWGATCRGVFRPIDTTDSDGVSVVATSLLAKLD